MITSDNKTVFFNNISKLWQNFKDYSYISGVTLSDEQIGIVEEQKEQMLVEGYAGTGKSLTLIYKLINVLTREENKKILFVTYNSTLIDDTITILKRSKEYCENVDKHKVDIMTFHEMASSILKEIHVINKKIKKLTFDVMQKIKDDQYRRVASVQAKYTQSTFDEYKNLSKEEKLYKTHNINFIIEEIQWMKAMGFIDIESYINTDRIGRTKSIRLTRNQRKTIFKIFKEYQRDIESCKYGDVLDLEDYALKILENYDLISDELKYDYIFVDEVQDLDPMQIKVLCKLSKKSIVLCGDAKQRIYKKCPIKYEQLGLNIYKNGRRKILKKNYRSTKEIVKLANSLKFIDENINKEEYKEIIESGEKPTIYAGKNLKNSYKYVVEEIKSIRNSGKDYSVAIITRDEIKKTYMNNKIVLEQELNCSLADIKSYSRKVNNKNMIFYTNVYDVKGLEFDIVFIMDFSIKYYPNYNELKKIKDKSEGKDDNLIAIDENEFINAEKKLLYVAMTRARKKLYLISSEKNKISNFIFDFDERDYIAKGFTKKHIKERKELLE